MANPSGANAKAGRALQQLVDASPKAGTNTLLVTHKTNITDAFGKEAAASGASSFVARIKAEDWLAQAAN